MIDTPTPDTWDTVLPLIQLMCLIILAVGAAASAVGRQRPAGPTFATVTMTTLVSSASCLAITSSVVIDTTHACSLTVIGTAAILTGLSVATLLAMWKVRSAEEA